MFTNTLSHIHTHGTALAAAWTNTHTNTPTYIHTNTPPLQLTPVSHRTSSSGLYRRLSNLICHLHVCKCVCVCARARLCVCKLCLPGSRGLKNPRTQNPRPAARSGICAPAHLSLTLAHISLCPSHSPALSLSHTSRCERGRDRGGGGAHRAVGDSHDPPLRPTPAHAQLLYFCSQRQADRPVTLARRYEDRHTGHIVVERLGFRHTGHIVVEKELVRLSLFLGRALQPRLRG